MSANAAVKEIDRRNKSAREEGIGLEDAIEQLADDRLHEDEAVWGYIEEAAANKGMRDAIIRIATRQRGKLSADEVVIALAVRNVALRMAHEDLLEVRR